MVEVGGRWPPVALRGRVCERHEFQLGALRERRAGTAGVQFVTGEQAVPGRVEAPRGESRPCSCQRLPENQAREQDKALRRRGGAASRHKIMKLRVGKFKGSPPNRDVASSVNRDAGRTERRYGAMITRPKAAPGQSRSIDLAPSSSPAVSCRSNPAPTHPGVTRQPDRAAHHEVSPQ